MRLMVFFKANGATFNDAPSAASLSSQAVHDRSETAGRAMLAWAYPAWLQSAANANEPDGVGTLLQRTSASRSSRDSDPIMSCRVFRGSATRSRALEASIALHRSVCQCTCLQRSPPPASHRWSASASDSGKTGSPAASPRFSTCFVPSAFTCTYSWLSTRPLRPESECCAEYVRSAGLDTHLSPS
jgi:hypothetical protein